MKSKVQSPKFKVGGQDVSMQIYALGAEAWELAQRSDLAGLNRNMAKARALGVLIDDDAFDGLIRKLSTHATQPKP